MLNEQLAQEKQELLRQNQLLSKQLLESEIAKLEQLAEENSRFFQNLTINRIDFDIHAYLKTSEEIEGKIAKLRQELAEIERQLATNKQVAQIENK